MFEKDKVTYLKKFDKKELLLPKYINIHRKLDEIKEEKIKCDIEIRFLQNKINIDSDSTVLSNYKENRNKYIELEKEESNLLKYLDTINNYNERTKNILEINSNINKIKKDKIKLYYELESLYKMKENPKFNNEIYQEKSNCIWIIKN